MKIIIDSFNYRTKKESTFKSIGKKLKKKKKNRESNDDPGL